MTNEVREFNKRYHLNVSKNAFVPLSRLSLANDLIGKPRSNLVQITRRFFGKPSSLLGVLAILTIILMAIIVPLTSHYSASEPVSKVIGERDAFANLPASGKWVIRSTGTDELIQIFRANGFLQGRDWNYVGGIPSGQLQPLITYDAWKYAQLFDKNIVSESIIGTNASAQDIWTRTWAGTGQSLILGFAVGIATTIVGTVIGSIAGLYYGSWFDIALIRIVEVISSVPSIVLIIIAFIIFPQNLTGLFILFLILNWTSPLYVARFNIIRFVNNDYMKVAKISGVSLLGRIFKHALPNFVGIMALVLSSSISGVIVSQAFINIIGINFDPTTPYLGNVMEEMRVEAIGGVTENLGYLLFPSAVLIAITMSLRYVGLGINDAINPKLSRR